jgi:phage terminase Nu1 subunit (DNA packaging protein)
MVRQSNPKAEPQSLKGWKEIAAYLGQPVAVAQRWARSGMPVEKRGRYVYSSPAALTRWLAGQSAGEPVQITTEKTDLGEELRRGLSFIRKHVKRKRAA